MTKSEWWLTSILLSCGPVASWIPLNAPAYLFLVRTLLSEWSNEYRVMVLGAINHPPPRIPGRACDHQIACRNPRMFLECCACMLKSAFLQRGIVPFDPREGIDILISPLIVRKNNPYILPTSLPFHSLDYAPVNVLLRKKYRASQSVVSYQPVFSRLSYTIPAFRMSLDFTRWIFHGTTTEST